MSKIEFFSAVRKSWVPTMDMCGSGADTSRQEAWVPEVPLLGHWVHPCWGVPSTCSLQEGLAAMSKQWNLVKVVPKNHVATAQMAEREKPLHKAQEVATPKSSGPALRREEELLQRHKPAEWPLPPSGKNGTWTGACPGSRDERQWTAGP